MNFKDYLYKGLLVLIAILAPIKTTLITTIMLILCDTISGVVAAKKQGIPITSAKLRNTLSKLVIYLTLIVLGFYVEKNMLDGFFPLISLITGVIGVVEMKSVLENMEIVLGTAIFSSLIEKLGSENLTKDLPIPKQEATPTSSSASDASKPS
jgi:hypothetical protein